MNYTAGEEEADARFARAIVNPTARNLRNDARPTPSTIPRIIKIDIWPREARQRLREYITKLREEPAHTELPRELSAEEPRGRIARSNQSFPKQSLAPGPASRHTRMIRFDERPFIRDERTRRNRRIRRNGDERRGERVGGVGDTINQAKSRRRRSNKFDFVYQGVTSIRFLSPGSPFGNFVSLMGPT